MMKGKEVKQHNVALLQYSKYRYIHLDIDIDEGTSFLDLDNTEFMST